MPLHRERLAGRTQGCLHTTRRNPRSPAFRTSGLQASPDSLHIDPGSGQRLHRRRVTSGNYSHLRNTGQKVSAEQPADMRPVASHQRSAGLVSVRAAIPGYVELIDEVGPSRNFGQAYVWFVKLSVSVEDDKPVVLTEALIEPVD